MTGSTSEYARGAKELAWSFQMGGWADVFKSLPGTFVERRQGAQVVCDWLNAKARAMEQEAASAVVE